MAIRIPVGGCFELSFPANASTGNSWFIVKINRRMLRLLDSVEVSPPRGSAPGVGGAMRFRFQAQKAGNTILQLRYGPSWDRGDFDRHETIKVSIFP